MNKEKVLRSEEQAGQISEKEDKKEVEQMELTPEITIDKEEKQEEIFTILNLVESAKRRNSSDTSDL